MPYEEYFLPLAQGQSLQGKINGAYVQQGKNVLLNDFHCEFIPGCGGCNASFFEPLENVHFEYFYNREKDNYNYQCCEPFIYCVSPKWGA